MRTRHALVCGVAGLVYVPLAALEGADILAAPEIDDEAAVARDYVTSHADAMTLTVSAGLLSLVAYVVFAISLYVLLRSSAPAERSPWPMLGLAGALGGVLLAGVGQFAAALVLVRRNDLDDDTITSLWQLSIDARTWAGFAGAVGLAGFGMARHSSAVMSRLLARLAIGLAALLLIATVVAVVDHGEESRLVVVGVFGIAAVWVFLVATWLVLGYGGGVHGAVHPTPHWALLLRQITCLVLVLAAGVTGVALVVLPGATADLFSWGLAPRPLASLVGGFYVASAVVFAGAASAPARRVRSLMVGAFAFATSTVVVTLKHREVFDFDRLQAVAWMVLFPVFALVVAVVVIAEPDTQEAEAVQRLGTGPRLAAGVLATALAVGAVALWIDPLAVDDALPFALSPMGGRFVGCWLALLAVLAASALRHGDDADAGLPAVALAVFPLSALIAATRVLPDLAGGWSTAGYLAAIVSVVAVGAWLAAVTRSGQDRHAHRPAELAQV